MHQSAKPHLTAASVPTAARPQVLPGLLAERPARSLVLAAGEVPSEERAVERKVSCGWAPAGVADGWGVPSSQPGLLMAAHGLLARCATDCHTAGARAPPPTITPPAAWCRSSRRWGRLAGSWSCFGRAPCTTWTTCPSGVKKSDLLVLEQMWLVLVAGGCWLVAVRVGGRLYLCAVSPPGSCI